MPAGRVVGWVGLGFALLIPWSVSLLFGSSAIIAAHLWAALIPVLPFTFAGAPLAVTKAMVQETAGSSQIGSTLDRDWSAHARTDLVRYDSPEVGLYSLQLYTDGGTPSQMTPFHGDSSSLSQLRRELPFIGYDLSPHSTMLSIGPGAGRRGNAGHRRGWSTSALWALASCWWRSR